MSFACDGLLIAIILFTVFNGWSKGFIKSITGLLKGGASAIAAYAFTPTLSAIVNERFILTPLTDGIFETLRGFAYDTAVSTEAQTVYNLDRLAGNLPADLVSILQRYNIDVPHFSTGIEGLTSVSEDVVRRCAEAIAAPTASILSSVLSFIVIFVGVFLALSLVTSLLDFIFRLPVLNAANKFLGLILGIAEALLITSVMSILISTLVTSLGSLEPDLFGPHVINNTLICKFLAEHNPLKQIYNVLV